MLCKKCELWENTIRVGSHRSPSTHCHHELEQLIEPGEKDVIKWAENHYWSSLQKDKALIIKHIKESFCSGEKPKEESSDNPYKIMLELCLNNLQSEISKARKKL